MGSYFELERQWMLLVHDARQWGTLLIQIVLPSVHYVMGFVGALKKKISSSPTPIHQSLENWL
jgi:hypothetical protein